MLGAGARGGRKVRLKTYAPRDDAENATSKVVAVFTVTNQGPEWLDLSSGSALRAQPSEGIQLSADLAMEDFTFPARSGSWWPF